MLVRGEAMVGSSLHEDRASLLDGDLLAFDLQHTCALEHDVHLVVLVRLLPVWLRCDKHVDAQLEACGFVDYLVATAGLTEPLLDGSNLEGVHSPEPTLMSGTAESVVVPDTESAASLTTRGVSRVVMSEIDTPPLEVMAMRKLILTVAAGLMLAAPAAAAPSTLIVAMRDPGCHWFYTGGGPNGRNYVKTIVRKGPVTLLNLDEAALVVKGPGTTKTERVGARLTLRAKGVYAITMVKQAPDDNHLKLTIK